MITITCNFACHHNNLQIIQKHVFLEQLRLIPLLTVVTLSIFYCQANTDNGSDTSYRLTRSSPLLQGSSWLMGVRVHEQSLIHKLIFELLCVHKQLIIDINVEID